MVHGSLLSCNFIETRIPVGPPILITKVFPSSDTSASSQGALQAAFAKKRAAFVQKSQKRVKEMKSKPREDKTVADSLAKPLASLKKSQAINTGTSGEESQAINTGTSGEESQAINTGTSGKVQQKQP
jgi:hypothetical protein